MSRDQGNPSNQHQYEEESVIIMNIIKALRSNWHQLLESYRTINEILDFRLISLQDLQSKTDQTISTTESDIEMLKTYIITVSSYREQQVFLEKLTVELDIIVEYYKEVQMQLNDQLKCIPLEGMKRVELVGVDADIMIVEDIGESMDYNSRCLQNLGLLKIRDKVSDLIIVLRTINQSSEKLELGVHYSGITESVKIVDAEADAKENSLSYRKTIILAPIMLLILISSIAILSIFI